MTEGKKEINRIIVFSSIFTIIPLIIIFELQNSWWEVLLKILSFYIIMLNLYNLFFGPLLGGVKSFGAGIVINMFLFFLFWVVFPNWSGNIIFIFLFVFNFGVMRKILKENYK